MPERRRTVLLNPGPVLLDERVRAAMGGPDVCHREAEVGELLRSVREALTRICHGDDRHSSVVLTGSGTSAVESCLTSVVRDDRLLVLDNGHYGERMAQIAAGHHIDVRVLDLGWGKPIDLRHVDSALGEDPEIRYLALVHHETSTGMLNDLRAVVPVAHAHGVEVIVDAVSSVGCEELDLVRGDADWVAGSANKCIEGVPGLSFVTGPRKGFERLPEQGRGFYLDLGRYYRAQEAGTVPFTPAVPALRAFDVACHLLLNEGVWARRSRYAGLTGRVRQGLVELGLVVRLDPRTRSSSLTCIDIPHGWTYGKLHDALLERGYVIYASQGPYAASQFRIATMGQIEHDDISAFLMTFEELLGEVSVAG